MIRLRARRFLVACLSLITLFALVACGTKIYRPDDGPAGLRLPAKVTGTNDKMVIALQKSLGTCGGKVLSAGQDYLISIPSVCLFPEQSPQLNWGSYPLLNKTVIFLKQFNKVAINVTSYSGKYVSAKREQALTLARSRAVANYLWSQGIDSRLIFMAGAGSDRPIIGYSLGGDKSLNSRIEISFRDTIV